MRELLYAMNEFKQPQNKSNEINQKFSMYFHTAFRNIGLYTSLSFGALAYSRVYRGITPLYDIALITISMVFLLLSFTINYMLNRDILQYLEQSDSSDNYKLYLYITNVVFGIHGILLLLGIGTLVRLYILR